MPFFPRKGTDNFMVPSWGFVLHFPGLSPALNSHAQHLHVDIRRTLHALKLIRQGFRFLSLFPEVDMLCVCIFCRGWMVLSEAAAGTTCFALLFIHLERLL